MPRCHDESGQATVEWVGLVVVVSLVLGALVAGNVRVPGVSLAEDLVERLVCAAGGDGAECAGIDGELIVAYGPRLASEVRDRVPEVAYEDGMRVLPVDFRSCRANRCAYGAESGRALSSRRGEPVTLFTRVVDCRGPARAAAARIDCSGERAGRLYLQYWAYYPDSRTKPWGDGGYHPDDWESFQVRLDSSGAESRASSHHGYNHRAGIGSWLSDAGLTSRSAWGLDRGTYYVSAGSHAGHAFEPPPTAPWLVRRLRRAGAPRATLRELIAASRPHRWTPTRSIRLVPLESLRGESRRQRFAVTPPWHKAVYRDPEDQGTD